MPTTDTTTCPAPLAELAERGYCIDEWSRWQQGGCGTYAMALLAERPSLRLAFLHDNDVALHFVAYDDQFAYDSAGAHPLPYHGVHGDLAIEYDQHPDWHSYDFPDDEGESLVDAAAHLRRNGILDRKHGPYGDTSAYVTLTDRMEAHFDRIWAGDATGFSETALRTRLTEYESDLVGLNNGTIRPSRIVGRGVAKPKTSARAWLTAQIAATREAIDTRGRSDLVNRGNAHGAALTFDTYDLGAIPGEPTRHHCSIGKIPFTGTEATERWPDAAAAYTTRTGHPLDTDAEYQTVTVHTFTVADDEDTTEVELGVDRVLLDWQHGMPPRMILDHAHDALAAT